MIQTLVATLVLAFALDAAAADAPAAKTDDAAPLASQSAAPSQSAEELDRASEQKVKEFEECVDTLGYFRADLNGKKAELDKEFKGKVPSSFANLLNLKANRIAKQQLACSKLANAPIDASMASARTMDSGSPAYAARIKTLNALRERLNKALKTFAAN